MAKDEYTQEQMALTVGIMQEMHKFMENYEGTTNAVTPAVKEDSYLDWCVVDGSPTVRMDIGIASLGVGAVGWGYKQTADYASEINLGVISLRLGHQSGLKGFHIEKSGDDE
jgi:hypothetical protein